MSARIIYAVLLWLIALIRGYYMLRFGFRPMQSQKPREWYDWAAEIGAYSIALAGSLYITLGEQLPLRLAAEDWLRGLGLGCMAAGVLLFALSHHALARHWSWNIGLRTNHRVVRQGLYHFVRHPMYTAIGLWMVAAPMITQSWLGLIPLLGLPGLYLRARAEETLLAQTFGPEYDVYRRRTGMFVPKP